MSTAKFDTLSNLAGTQTVPVATVAQGSAKCWVNFNGTGTVAIRASFNVSSITDNGTGDYTVNFTTAMPDANFSAYAMNMDGGDGFRAYGVIGRSYTSSTFRFIVINASNVYADPSTLGVGVFR